MHPNMDKIIPMYKKSLQTQNNKWCTEEFKRAIIVAEVGLQ